MEDYMGIHRNPCRKLWIYIRSMGVLEATGLYKSMRETRYRDSHTKKNYRNLDISVTVLGIHLKTPNGNLSWITT